MNYTLKDIAEIVSGKIISQNSQQRISSVFYDSRMPFPSQNSLFIAFKTERRNGHSFIPELLDKNILNFLIDEKKWSQSYSQANFILVSNTLKAFQKLAAFHRQKFNLNVIGITGSYGKTIVKEWLYQTLTDKFNIVRSPKSYNSSIGVPYSILLINQNNNLGIFEAGISQKNDMKPLSIMINPQIGILTTIGEAHNNGFINCQEKIVEKLQLFNNCHTLIFNEDNLCRYINSTQFYKNISPKTKLLNISEKNKNAYCFVKNCLISEKNTTLLITIEKKIYKFQLPFIDKHSIDNCLYIILILKLFNFTNTLINEKLQNLQAISLKIFQNQLPVGNIDNKIQFHSSTLWVNAQTIKENLNKIINHIQPHTQIMAILKASGYGLGSLELAKLLDFSTRVTYLAVAYIDEAILLKESGILKPIMLMNVEEQHFPLIVKYNIEPEIYDYTLLLNFINFIKAQYLFRYPIHLKINSGMNRLGFGYQHIENLAKLLAQNPTLISIKSVFSHLIDGKNNLLCKKQFTVYSSACHILKKSIPTPFIQHLASSSSLNKKYLQLDLIRLGIGLLGYSSALKLSPSIKLIAEIAQIHSIKKGGYIGYGTENKINKDTKIATVKIGYADGFRRELGNGRIKMFVCGKYAPTIGNICMDLCFIDVTHIPKIEIKDKVEIIGSHCSLENLAQTCNTIPYEILTTIGPRIKRVFY